MTSSRTIIVVIVLIVAAIAFYLFRMQAEPVAEVPPVPEPPSTYEGANFSIPFPDGYAVDPAYAYEALGPENVINGVKFTIPASIAEGTNLSEDSYISVETIPGEETCSADLFLGSAVIANPVTEEGVTYSVASASDAAAGNRYEETVYAFPGTNPCIGVRYFIHYGVFENYPEGSIEEFDKQALFDDFDEIRRSLVVTQ